MARLEPFSILDIFTVVNTRKQNKKTKKHTRERKASVAGGVSGFIRLVSNEYCRFLVDYIATSIRLDSVSARRADMSKRSVLTARIAADPHVATATRVESTASRTAESTWSDISFRNLLPRSDVSVVTLPMEGNHAVAAGGGAKDRILHFVIGGQTSESSESDIVEAIEWHCRRSWRMASLNCARLGCGAALLRGVIYTVGGLSSDSTVLSSVEKFSFFQEEKRWDLLSKLSDLKTPRWGHAVVSLQRHNAIFAVGGRNASWEELSSVEVAQQNAAGDLQWNRLPYGMRQKRFGATAAMVTSASIMVCGGFNGSAWTKTVCQYEVEGDDVRDGTWIDLPDMPKPVVFGKATATTLNGSLFVFVAGASEDGQSVLQAFSVKQQKWSIMETNGGEDGCSLAVEGDTLLCVGGDSNVVRSLNLTMECEQGSLVALCGGVQGLSVGIPEVAAVAQNSFSSMSAEPQRVEKKACVVEGENAQYTGEINAAGQRHGKGLLVWANKDGTFLPKEMSKNSYYEGGFDQDYRRGEGVLFVMEEGRLYQGNFERGVLSGPGTLIDVMLRLQYDGGFRKGMPIGEGRCDYSDTRRSFIGTWKRGKPIAGRLVDANDRVLQSIGPWSKELFIDLSRAGTPRTDEITGPSTVNKKDCMVESKLTLFLERVLSMHSLLTYCCFFGRKTKRLSTPARSTREVNDMAMGAWYGPMIKGTSMTLPKRKIPFISENRSKIVALVAEKCL
jgi:hypothetical protein